MERWLTVLFALLPVAGCAPGPPPPPPWYAAPVFHDNPAWVPVADHQLVWETVVDVVDDYFKIEREDPVRLVGTVLTEGRLETLPVDTPTVFEPWRPDSGSSYDRLEDTLQSTRRWAVVRVIPDEGGFWVDVAVHRELEDLQRPVHGSAGAATFRSDTSLTRVVNPEPDEPLRLGWIPIGRDMALERRI
ncbi:MAG TPA: hypothetical protein EYP56_04555, partial [Planctomycetaceae bacterium]|nr:hypothetical protein [Planctomycetaceae bacterium]